MEKKNGTGTIGYSTEKINILDCEIRQSSLHKNANAQNLKIWRIDWTVERAPPPWTPGTPSWEIANTNESCTH